MKVFSFHNHPAGNTNLDSFKRLTSCEYNEAIDKQRERVKVGARVQYMTTYKNNDWIIVSKSTHHVTLRNSKGVKESVRYGEFHD